MKQKINKKYLAIFDLDGTLFDTAEVNYYSYKSALEKYNIRLDKEIFMNKYNGLHYTKFLPDLVKDENLIETIHNDKKNLYKDNLSKARKNTHLFELMDLIKDKYNLALVTTASKQNTMDILDYFRAQNIFDLIITQEDVVNKKPDPEGFIKAIKYFKTDIKNVIVFEDSPSGIIPAEQIGATVFKIIKF